MGREEWLKSAAACMNAPDTLREQEELRLPRISDGNVTISVLLGTNAHRQVSDSPPESSAHHTQHMSHDVSPEVEEVIGSFTEVKVLTPHCESQSVLLLSSI